MWRNDISPKNKHFVTEEALLNDSFRLAVAVYASGFRPNFIVGIWRGGSTVGIYVQECLQYLGVQTDHISIRTSYRGMEDYLKRIDRPQNIRVHGLQYLFENLNSDDRLLIVDDVYSTGRSIEAVLNRLRSKTKRNMPADVRVAAPYFKPARNQTDRVPDYYLHETKDWLVLPYELTGLSNDEITEHKAWMLPILEACRPA
ncbi:phosphoribosyltransferase [Halioglobus pacificus]|uniref:Hypoxanthine phosphoribosyltransferase n=1 Tax=Parahalioglobus pacificus TaxID=930806 RepID=A0A918XC93_9GAMM|nr:phosphoribosyltransferase family protein [Halioglobus pacificus]GHD25519.1 hypoxanthine phosphoribosyltransferase [Halioglobus pacificus]